MKPSIIYIDDDEINLILFRELFIEDFEITTYVSGLEALEYLKTTKVDYILTDQQMPVITGIEFLWELKKICLGQMPRRIMVSGTYKPKEVKQALRNKLMDGFIAKPWTYDALKRIIFGSADAVKQPLISLNSYK